jgi:DNA-binding transcriptional MerR regulator
MVRCSIVIEKSHSCQVGCAPRLWYRRPIQPAAPLFLAAMPSRAESTSYTISDLAREFALTTRAIRFYEDEGLLAPRRNGQHRVYGERERVRIKLILRGKRLGLALAEIRELLDLYDATRSERPQLVKFLQLLAQRRALLEQQQEDVAIVLAEIDQLERQCRRRLRQGGNGRHGAA